MGTIIDAGCCFVGNKDLAIRIVEEFEDQIFTRWKKPWSIPGMTDIVFSPMPDKYWRLWNDLSRNISDTASRFIYTGFGMEVDHREWWGFIGSLIRELADVNYSLYVLEAKEFLEYLKKAQEGVPRAQYDRKMAAARLLLYSKYWEPPSIPKGYKKVLPLPAFSRRLDIRIKNPSALIGWPYPGVKFFDMTRSIEENAELKDKIEASSRSLARVLKKKSYSKSALKDIGLKGEVWHGQGKKNQSGGRPIIMVSKILNFISMSYMQSLSDQMGLLPWNYTGDRLLRSWKMDKFASSSPGNAITDGDDGASRFPNGFLSYDVSAADSQWRKSEHLAYEKALQCSFIGSKTDLALLLSIWRMAKELPVSSFGGFLKLPTDSGELSGEGGTHVRVGWWEACRAYSEYPESHSVEEFISNLQRWGEYRPEKQLFFKDLCTVSQTVFIPGFRPRYIKRDRWPVSVVFGKLSRFAYGMLEMEGLTTPLSTYQADLQVVQKCMNLYGHPSFEAALDKVSEIWEIRSKPQLVWSAIMASSRPGKHSKTSMGGHMEKEAYRVVIDRLTS